MFKTALVYAWLFYSALLLLVVLVAILVPEATIYGLTPQCYSVKHLGKQCFMCGSTRSFVAMGHGYFAQAWRYNRFSSVLFAVVIINSFVSIIYLSTNLKTKQLL